MVQKHAEFAQRLVPDFGPRFAEIFQPPPSLRSNFGRRFGGLRTFAAPLFLLGHVASLPRLKRQLPGATI
ncbi:hypothetical protein C5688_05470 [Methylocystis sp. MitZ-2018]|nr:hypothetical protein C5688_05470 [Methylocystis sp. MitZ-2018]